MKYIDGFRNGDAAAALRRRIERLAGELPGRDVAIMEVCGSHTMAIARYGIRQVIPKHVRLVSGPGCPVCVTGPGYIDAAMELARAGTLIATFGDMMNVPGSDGCLADVRAEGSDVEVCYSPSVAIELALNHPGREVVFLAIGFETTVPPVVSLVNAARKRNIPNLSLLTAFKLVPPALRILLDDPEVRIDAFLCPAHVSAIIGPEAYEPFAGEDGVPCIIAGFEPLDILLGVDGILQRIVAGKRGVENQYSRVVKPGGNKKAQALMETYLEPVDALWRGLGVLPASGLALRAQFAGYDAEKRHGIDIGPGKHHPGCRCGDVLKGKCLPPDCPMFGHPCNPDHPVGPCMVSSEGSCSAHYKYGREA